MHSQVLSLLSKSRDKMTYVWGKAERTCVILAIGLLSMDMCPVIEEEEREIQNVQVNFIKVWRQEKVICRSTSSIEAHA